MAEDGFKSANVPRFTRDFLGSGESIARIGGGELGGKAKGLAFIRDALTARLDAAAFPWAAVNIPTLVVIGTDVFDAFMERNGLQNIALSETRDDRLAHAFQQAELPTEILGDLKALMDQVQSPLAVRSSSLLEDALFRPFAGVYATKMIPNNQPRPDARFKRLVEAIKFVYASTYFAAARSYRRAADCTALEEKMAVIIQEVVGTRHGDRYYPDLSGVARSYNFYPSGRARPEEGVVSLALGLGKTIVDGGVCWSYSPAHPKAPPPFGSVGDLLKNTQLEFWAVNMGRPPEYDPASETEYLGRADLAAADYDGTLPLLASTYDGGSDRLVPGTGSRGPRVINFAPLLVAQRYPLNDLLSHLMEISEAAVGTDVEIEFAASLPDQTSDSMRLGFLQVRPMVAPGEKIEISDSELASPNLLLASSSVMGSGEVFGLRDIVYVKPASFDKSRTRLMVSQIETLNASLMSEGHPYLLAGFGRWGSSDPWLGIPVEWGDICGAKVIVEATLPEMNVDPSQGSHFFHNLTSFRVGYFMVHHASKRGMDWQWLDKQPAVLELEDVRHVRLDEALIVKLDGRSGRGGIWRAG